MPKLLALFGRTFVLKSWGVLVVFVTPEQPGSGIAADETGLQLYGFSFMCALNPNETLQGSMSWGEHQNREILCCLESFAELTFYSNRG